MTKPHFDWKSKTYVHHGPPVERKPVEARNEPAPKRPDPNLVRASNMMSITTRKIDEDSGEDLDCWLDHFGLSPRVQGEVDSSIRARLFEALRSV